MLSGAQVWLPYAGQSKPALYNLEVLSQSGLSHTARCFIPDHRSRLMSCIGLGVLLNTVLLRNTPKLTQDVHLLIPPLSPGTEEDPSPFCFCFQHFAQGLAEPLLPD